MSAQGRTHIELGESRLSVLVDRRKQLWRQGGKEIPICLETLQRVQPVLSAVAVGPIKDAITNSGQLKPENGLQAICQARGVTGLSTCTDTANLGLPKRDELLVGRRRSE
jgi:hypothetical protein